MRRPSRASTSGGGAGEIRRSEDFFDLRAMAITMRGDEQHPLVAIQIAESTVRKKMFPRIGAHIGGEIDGSLAGRFEFADKLIARPAVRRLYNFGRLAAIAAVKADLQKLVIPAIECAALGCVGRLAQRVGDVLEETILDGDEVLDTFGHGPAVRARLELQLRGRKTAGGAQQIIACLRKITYGAFTIGRRHCPSHFFAKALRAPLR
jgi:hypothetical protein